MQVNITGRHIHVSDETRDFIEDRVDRFERYFQQITSTQVTLDSNKNNEVHVEILVHVINKVTFVVNEAHMDPHIAVDRASDRIERKIRQFKEKVRAHRDRKGVPEPPVEDDGLDDLEEIEDILDGLN